MKTVTTYVFEDTEEAITYLGMVKDHILYKTYGLSGKEERDIREMIGEILEELGEG